MIESGDTIPDLAITLAHGGASRLVRLRRALAGALLLSQGQHSRPAPPKAWTSTRCCRSSAARRPTILGVSRESVKSHQNFCAKTGLQVRPGQRRRRNPVPRLRRDQAEEELYGRDYIGVERSTFLIDPAGRVVANLAWRARSRPRRSRADALKQARVTASDKPPAFPCPPSRIASHGGASLPHHQEPTMTRSKRIYVLDTNVLMHDPTALFKFEEHDVYLPMQVLEELDNAKKGTSEVSRNARQVSRFINELIEATAPTRSRRPHAGAPARACSCAQPEHRQAALPDRQLRCGASVGKVMPDNQILGAILVLQESEPACRWCSCPRTSTCGSRPRSPASRRKITRTTARSTISVCSTPAPARCRRTSGSARPGPALVDGEEAARSTKSRAARTTSGIRTNTSICPATTRPRCASRASTAIAWCCRSSTITAATSMRCGASPRAIASRISR
jgi:peroxiredoxin